MYHKIQKYKDTTCIKGYNMYIRIQKFNMKKFIFFFRVTQCKGRLVTAHCWDMEDPRLLVCRAQRLDSRDSKSYYKSGDQVIFIKKN